MNQHVNATPFAQGYKSTPETRALVLKQIAAVWEKFPALRFGQLLDCVASKDLPNIRDEKLIAKLQTSLDYTPQGLN